MAEHVSGSGSLFKRAAVKWNFVSITEPPVFARISGATLGPPFLSKCVKFGVAPSIDMVAETQLLSRVIKTERQGATPSDLPPSQAARSSSCPGRNDAGPPGDDSPASDRQNCPSAHQAMREDWADA